MRSICVTAALSVALAVLAQDAKRLVLSSHDRIEGPIAGEYHVEDLQVFEDGKVVYAEDRGSARQIGKPEQVANEATISSDEVRRLTELLDRRELRSIPKRVPSKARTIDFFWQKSLAINRLGKTQKIEIENFYPFLNMDKPVYPRGLIELECRLQHIKAVVTKRQGEDVWCGALLSQGSMLPPNSAHVSVESDRVDCRGDEAQQRIVAGRGWGPVSLGAAAEAVDAFLGEGQEGGRNATTHFKDYVLKGIQVSFQNTTDTVHAIFFYNGQRHNEQSGVFCGQTDRGINWQSPVEEVKKIYGIPTAEFSGTDSGGTWQRLVFAGIDFRFENGRMVRIGVPGN